MYCPINYRTIEVNFDLKKGRYVGFQQLLNQCAPEKGSLPRLVASIFKRLDGAEVEVTHKELVEMGAAEPRISHTTVKGDVAGGGGLAIAPRIEFGC